MSASPVRNWAGNVTFAAARVHRPRTLDEVRRIVAGADRVHVLGSGHSFNRVADTDGDLLRLDRLPRTVEIDREAMTATVDGGATYVDVAPVLHREGLALANLPSLPHVTVAGAVATATHGSGHRLPCLSAAVTAVELVTASGDLVRLRRGDADLPGSVVALGALGVVTRLTLEVEPTFQVAQTVVLDVPLDGVQEAPDGVLESAYSVSLFTDWGSRGALWLKRRVGVDDGPLPTFGGRPATRAQHTLPTARADGVNPQLGRPGPWHERLPHFRADGVPATGAELQSDLYLPRAAAGAAIAALRDLAPSLRPALQIGEMRCLAADDLWLSPAHGRDSVSFHFTWNPDADVVLPAIRAVEERLVPLGGRPHWGKVTTTAPATIVAGYERAGDFAALSTRLDPTGAFRNPLLDGLFPRS
jgi:alditol oxidase